MHPTMRNILAIIAGIVIGGFVNYGIILISGSIIPPPEGVDMTTTEGIKSGMHLLEPRHFIMPFLAHAIGTFVGAFIAAKTAATHKLNWALGVGLFFLLGGIASAFSIPAPTWFVVVDIVAAYLPMGWLGGKLAIGKPVS